MKAKQTYIALPGGETCRLVNPYEHKECHPCNDNSDSPKPCTCSKRELFEANAPILPTTEQIDEGEFQGVEVLQWQDPYTVVKEWKTEPDLQSHHYSISHGYKTRIAISPIKEKNGNLYTETNNDDGTHNITLHQEKVGIKEEKEVPKDCKWPDCTADNCCSSLRHKGKPLQAVDANKGTKPYWCETCGEDLIDWKCACKPLRANVPEESESIEDRADKWVDNNLDLLDEYMPHGAGSIGYQAGWNDRAQWQQSHNELSKLNTSRPSVESIVPKVLEWVAERAKMIKKMDGEMIHERTQAFYYTDGKIEIDTPAILNMKADIIKELNK